MALTPSEIQARKSGIGGSDLESVIHRHLTEMGHRVFGCDRRLWYDKMGIEPDFPADFGSPVERGNFMEPIIAFIYTEKTGNKTRNQPNKTNKDRPWEKVSIDRQIIATDQGTGILECKSVGSEVWKEIRDEGLPLRYVIQVLWGLYIYGYEWGELALLCNDPWDFKHIPILRDETLIKLLAREAEAFWKKVQAKTPPEKLRSNDTRCLTCEYGPSCQGETLLIKSAKEFAESNVIPEIEGLEPLVVERQKYADIIKVNEVEFKELSQQIRELMGTQTAAIVEGFTISYSPIASSKIVDGKKLEDEFPEVYHEVLKDKKGSRPLNIKKRKG